MPMTLKAAAKSNPKALAGALTGALRGNGSSAEIHAIGAGAVNQAMKAIARGCVVPSGGDLVCVPRLRACRSTARSEPAYGSGSGSERG